MNSNGGQADVIAISVGVGAAIIAFIAAVVAALMESRSSRRNQLEELWSAILSLTADDPKLCDVAYTNHYLTRLTWSERLRYDAICLQAWSLVHAAYQSRVRSHRFNLAMKWMAGFHSEWLENNRHLFPNRRFRRAYRRTMDRESVILRHRAVRSSDLNDDPKVFTEQYFERVLSPFDPSMSRSALADAVAAALKSCAGGVVLDLSLGPALMYRNEAVAAALAECQGTIVSVEPSLEAASEITDYGAVGLLGRLDALPFVGESIELVVAVNTILESSRDLNVNLLREIGRVLSPDGTAVLVLPAFEALSHLGDLRAGGPPTKQRKMLREMHAGVLRIKRPDQESASYMDDGTTREYFHSLATIPEELAMAGLQLLAEPTKVAYPWDLCRRFDYGYYPDSDPVWDWLVLCRRF
jgi:SAM-dependent methyltransferase